MSHAFSSAVPGWTRRTWPLVALGLLSVAMWTGRIRNIAGDESLTGPGRVVRVAIAVSFVVLGAAVLAACAAGRRNPNWRMAAWRSDDGWRVGPGVPAWGHAIARILCGWTAVVWLVQGIGILLDPNHDVGFKAVHTFLMVGSLVVAAVAAWGLRRSWPVAPPATVG